MEKLTIQSTIAQALQNPRAVAVIEARYPGIIRHPAVRMFRRLPLERLTRMERLGLTMDQLEELLRQINDG